MSTQIRNGRLALGTWQGESARYARYTSFRNVDMFLLLVVDYTNSSHILLIVACPHLFLSLFIAKKKKGIYLNEHRDQGGWGGGHTRNIIITLQGQS